MGIINFKNGTVDEEDGRGEIPLNMNKTKQIKKISDLEIWHNQQSYESYGIEALIDCIEIYSYKQGEEMITDFEYDIKERIIKSCKKEITKRLSNNKPHKTINFYSPQEIEDIKKQTVGEFKERLVKEFNEYEKTDKNINNIGGISFSLIKEIINNFK